MNKFPTGEAVSSLAEMKELLSAPDVTVTVDEGQRQMLICALATLAAERPGWIESLQAIALKIDNEVGGKPQMFTKLHGLYARNRAVAR